MGTTEGTCFLVGYKVGFLVGSRFLLMRPSGTTAPVSADEAVRSMKMR